MPFKKGSGRRELMDRFTERFVDLVCIYRKQGLSNSDLKFMIEVFVADQMDKTDAVEAVHSTKPKKLRDAITIVLTAAEELSEDKWNQLDDLLSEVSATERRRTIGLGLK